MKCSVCGGPGSGVCHFCEREAKVLKELVATNTPVPKGRYPLRW